MKISKTFRKIAVAGVLTVAAALCAQAMRAQRGGAPPPPPPPPPSNPGGGNLGGMGMRSSPFGPPMGPGNLRHRGSALGLPGRWWNDQHVIGQLKLRPNQQKQMDAIFESHKAALTSSLNNLQQQRGQLSSLSKKDLQDETKVLAAIDHVVAARSDLAKETTRVLIDLRQQLDPQQAAEFDKQIASARQQ